MPFKTADDGHVYNDDRKHSGSHHGSVRPGTGIKSHGIHVKKIKLENRAWKGIRAYTDPIFIEGVPVVFEIQPHRPWGKYIITGYDNNRGLEELRGLREAKFDKFEQAKDYLENRFKIKLELDEHPSNHQTWQQNIKQTDHELPFDRKFWGLPDRIRSEYGEKEHESIEQFLKRKHLV